MGFGDAARLGGRVGFAFETGFGAAALRSAQAAWLTGRAREQTAHVVLGVALEAWAALAVQFAAAARLAGFAARCGAQAEHVVALEVVGTFVVDRAQAAAVAFGAVGRSDAQAFAARRAVRARVVRFALATAGTGDARVLDFAHTTHAFVVRVGAERTGEARAAWRTGSARFQHAFGARVALEAEIARRLARDTARATERTAVAVWHIRAGGDEAEHDVVRVGFRIDVDRRGKRLWEQVERVVTGVDRVTAVHVDGTGSNAHVVVLFVRWRGHLRLESVGERAFVRQLLHGVRRRVQKVHEALFVVVVDQTEFRNVVVVRGTFAVGDARGRVTARRAASERERVEHDFSVRRGFARLVHFAHDQRRLDVFVEVEDGTFVEERHERHVWRHLRTAVWLTNDVVKR